MSASPLQAEGNGDAEAIPPSEEVGQIRIGDTVQEQNQDGEAEGPMEVGDPLYAEVKEQDRWLPIANVARIMKIALPDNAKIAKEAKECMQECVSEFISFITSEASEKCQQEKRKTVNGEDILFAMTSLGFENYGEALKIYLSRYRETHVPKGESTHTKASTAREAATAASAEADPDTFYQDDAAKTGGVGEDSIYAGLDVKQQVDSKPSHPLSLDQPTAAGASAVDPQFDDPSGAGGIAGDALPSYDV